MNDAVELWQIPLAVPDSILNRYWAYLSEDEKARGDRFRFAEHRRRFVVARGVLRCLLGKQLGRSPHAVQFCYGKYGKPALSRSAYKSAFAYKTAGDVHFNLSHSGELALCVLGGDRTVGVDIEHLKSIKRLDGMMERCLTAEEIADVSRESETAQLKAFLQRWTCKEAYLKAIGSGLTQSMQSVEVKLDPARFMRVPQVDKGWQLTIVNMPDSYVGALAIEAGDRAVAVNVRDWQHES